MLLLAWRRFKDNHVIFFYAIHRLDPARLTLVFCEIDTVFQIIHVAFHHITPVCRHIDHVRTHHNFVQSGNC